MNIPSNQQGPGDPMHSLSTLLGSIDRETASALAWDQDFLKARVRGNRKKKRAHISFELGRRQMALPIDAIQEIGHLPLVVPLPHLPPWIKGIVQVRGEILSVLDFITLFDLQGDRPMGPRQSYLLLRIFDLQFCLPVGRITGLLHIDDQLKNMEAQPCPEAMISPRLAQVTQGLITVSNRKVTVLDAEKLAESPWIRKWQDA
ncbi:chemotaxis protein CheW [Desulfobulbus alkaliphilus]|uniref:chemotaxis protein CheW n=1 Tax=Desulfobulbus alkaliphilus TaxID=869814 RepID=UPI001965B673|nr:chemotaxis protein CheW [Desulfobulbus alkaliphilus]MBM9536451.1 chemotaxis protein CheW [Desulfobulbus alkaliphilus]